ncbi:hypothetical protein DJ549_21020 [Klebsiella grimontii]|nr:hypothetical protein DJ549_21020 [Klebsiella grimontii]
MAKRITIHQNEVSNVVSKAGCIGSGSDKADISSSIQTVILIIVTNVLVTSTELKGTVFIVSKKDITRTVKKSLETILFICLS